MGDEINRWALDTLATEPGWTFSDVIKLCANCQFTYSYEYCQYVEEIQGFMCFNCLGRTDIVLVPFCWGTSHGQHPTPREFGEFTPTVSTMFCNYCYETGQYMSDSTSLMDMTSPRDCASVSGAPISRECTPGPKSSPAPDVEQEQYDSLILLQNASGHLPEGHRELLSQWIAYYGGQGRGLPRYCINCLRPNNTNVSEIDPFCRPCRNGEFALIWANFKMCRTCYRVGPRKSEFTQHNADSVGLSMVHIVRIDNSSTRTAHDLGESLGG